MSKRRLTTILKFFSSSQTKPKKKLILYVPIDRVRSIHKFS